jgi:hypothetical protein
MEDAISRATSPEAGAGVDVGDSAPAGETGSTTTHPARALRA